MHGRKLGDELELTGSAGEGAIKIHHVEKWGRRKARGEVEWITDDFSRRSVSFSETNGLTFHQIDCGIDHHRSQSSSRRIPARPLFSG
jgi:hypothetical protein